MPEPTTQRTYSSWIFIAAFAVLAVIGIVAFVGGGGVTGTQTLDTPRPTLAASSDPTGAATEDAAGDAAADDASATAGDEDSASDKNSASDASRDQDPGTGTNSDTGTGAPSGDAAAGRVPDGATLQRDGDASSYTYPAPDSMAGADDELRVEIASATATATGSTLAVTVNCTHNADEHLGQVIVNEGSMVVTVVPLLIVPAGGGPCIGGVEGTEHLFSLTAPIGNRTVVVVPVTTPIPEGINLLGT